MNVMILKETNMVLDHTVLKELMDDIEETKEKKYEALAEEKDKIDKLKQEIDLLEILADAIERYVVWTAKGS